MKRIKDTTGQWIFAASLIVAWALCLVASYIVPAILMAGMLNKVNGVNGFLGIRARETTPVDTVAWVLLVAALLSAGWAVLSGREPRNKTEPEDAH